MPMIERQCDKGPVSNSKRAEPILSTSLFNSILTCEASKSEKIYTLVNTIEATSYVVQVFQLIGVWQDVFGISYKYATIKTND